MKKVFFVFFLAIVFISCEDVLEPLLKDDFFPLAVGNSWTFEIAGTDSVTGAKTVSGKERYDITRSTGDVATYYKKKNKIYQVKEGGEEMIFDLAADKNETWEFDIGLVKMVNRNENIIFRDTVISNCLRFDFYNPNIQDYGYSIWLAPNLGYVKKNCRECYGASFQTLKLRKAKINGIVIDLE